MQHKVDLDALIQQAAYDAFARYTLDHGPRRSNLDRVAKLAAEDLVRNWGPELATALSEAVKAEMEGQLYDLTN